MNVPEQVSVLATGHGFNSVELAGRAPDGSSIYSVGCVDGDGFALPTGLPHYIIERDGVLSLVCDGDFRITDAL